MLPPVTTHTRLTSVNRLFSWAGLVISVPVRVAEAIGDLAEWQMSADRLAPPVPSAEAEALDRTTDSDLLRALRDLPGEFRTAVYLADIEGYPYREIAEIMGTPVGTVMSRLHRGRRKIREQLMASGFGAPQAESSGA